MLDTTFGKWEGNAKEQFWLDNAPNLCLCNCGSIKEGNDRKMYWTRQGLENCTCLLSMKERQPLRPLHNLYLFWDHRLENSILMIITVKCQTSALTQIPQVPWTHERHIAAPWCKVNANSSKIVVTLKANYSTFVQYLLLLNWETFLGLLFQSLEPKWVCQPNVLKQERSTQLENSSRAVAQQYQLSQFLHSNK